MMNVAAAWSRWWKQILHQGPLRLLWRSFPDPDAPRPWSEDARDRARALDAWDARRESKNSVNR
jgi:hypothetical protein